MRPCAPVIAPTFVALTMLGCSPPAASDRPPGADTQALAATLVQKNAGVREGEVVLVSGGIRDWDLMENIAVEVRKVGAHPLVTAASESLVRRLATEVPAKYDGQTPALDLKLAAL